MSRWKSPQTAAKHAQSAAKQAEQLRKEKRKSRLMLIGVALVSISLVVADYFWLRARARQRHQQHLQRQHRKEMQTNEVATPDATATNRNRE